MRLKINNTSTIAQLIVILMLTVVVAVVSGSRGDQEEEYLECLSGCLKVHQCSVANDHPSSAWLRFLGWSCRDECRYECMWEVVRERRVHGLPIEQYHGKWPFIRIAGIQEPASVVFSILNGLAHIFGLAAYKRRVGTKGGSGSGNVGGSGGSGSSGNVGGSGSGTLLMTVYAAVAVNAWIWSSIFHTRDTDWTERMDYFSAAALLFFSLFLSIAKLFYSNSRGGGGLGLFLIGVGLMGWFMRYVYYLGWVRFDYGYNMTVMVALGLTFNGLWFAWGLANRKHLRSARLTMVWTVVATLAGALELLEFVPLWDTIDAHSLWHAVTVPLAYAIYRILALRKVEQQQQKHQQQASVPLKKNY